MRSNGQAADSSQQLIIQNAFQFRKMLCLRYGKYSDMLQLIIFTKLDQK